MSISLAMIAKNEARSIGHCLQSVHGLVDEIIVVDTGSTDATAGIASQEGAYVLHFPWVNDFAAARNESLRHCTCDWVLILDADEAIDALDHPLIRETCQNATSQAYHLTLRNYHTSSSYYIQDVMAQKNTSAYREGREYPFYVDAPGLRLCRRTPDLAFTGRIHELLDPYFKARSIPIMNLVGAVIHHFGKLDEDRERIKGRAYLDLALKDLQTNPSNTQFLFNVVQQGLQAQDWPVVLESAETYQRLRSGVPSLIHFGAGLASQKLGQQQQALFYFDQLLRTLPDHALALTYRGISLVALGREGEAEQSYKEAMRINPRFSLPYVSFTDLAFKQGRIEEARASIQQGVANCPSDSLILKGLLLFDLRTNDMEQAMADARRALDAFPKEGDGLWHRLAALSEQKAGRTSEAVAILERGIALFPKNAALTRMRDEFSAQA
jgi:tetratricopeptide (TPR) repeat protein